MENEILKKLSIDDVLTPEAGNMWKQVTEAFQNAQEYIAAIQGKDKLTDLDLIKIGTTLTFGILTVLSSGKNAEDLTKQDWAEILQYVGENVLLRDEEPYSRYVFSLYAQYIDYSADQLEGYVSDKKVQAIHDLAFLMRAKETALINGAVSEVDYTEECLWISFEAMIKLLATIPALLTKNNLVEDFSDAITMFGVQYARLMLYQKEKELLDEYFDKQKQLDQDLEKRLNRYLEQVKENQSVFNELISEAFDDDVLSQHIASVRLARNLGVAEEDILISIDDIDDFFMN